MKITQDVVRDLLPAYAAGEASSDTRLIVEEWLSRDPQLTELLKLMQEPPALASVLSETGSVLPPNHEKETLNMTKQSMKTQSWLMGIAIFCSLIPFSFTVENSRLVSLMARDSPSEAAAFAGLAILRWIAYGRTRSKLKTTGL
jgi:anti-sigma factor RsiW